MTYIHTGYAPIPDRWLFISIANIVVAVANNLLLLINCQCIGFPLISCELSPMLYEPRAR